MTAQIQAALKVADDSANGGVSRAFNFTPAGTKWFSHINAATTAAATIAVSPLSTLEFVSLCNPSTNTATVTVSFAPIVLKPGYVALVPPSTVNVTIQATAACNIQTAGTET